MAVARCRAIEQAKDMGLAERVEMYRSLEALRGHPMLCYVTSNRQNAPGMMAGDAVPEFLDQLSVLPADAKAIDLLIVSMGGDPTVAWRIMSLLRERVERVSVMVPQAAFSAATLLALGADEIVMHPHGNLGPVDPQITVERPQPDGKGTVRQQFGFQDLVAYVEFLQEEVGIGDQAQIKDMLLKFCDEVGAVPVGVAARSGKLSVTLAERLLAMHTKSDEKASAIAENLAKNYFHHGHALSRREAKEIGLEVTDPSKDIEELMWRIWLDIEAELQMRRHFSPVDVLADSKQADLVFGPVSQVNIPSNLPSQVQDQIIQQVLQQIQVVQIAPVDHSLTHAIMESTRRASRMVAKGKIFARRGADLDIKVNNMMFAAGWEEVTLPPAPAEGGTP